MSKPFDKANHRPPYKPSTGPSSAQTTRQP